MQSDWFLPVLISHDIDMVCGVLGMFHAHAPGLSIITQGFIFVLKGTIVIIDYFCTYFSLRMRIKVLFLQLAWFVRPDKTRT